MPDKKVENKKPTFADRKPDNFPGKPVLSNGVDCSAHLFEHFHLERKGEGVIIVSDGIEDFDKAVQEEACNAGLVNILKMQEMRYGTIENAVKRNQDKQVYADVSKVPTSVAEQAEYIANTEKELNALCQKLGISKEELLKTNVDTLQKLFEQKQAAAAPAESTEGDK